MSGLFGQRVAVVAGLVAAVGLSVCLTGCRGPKGSEKTNKPPTLIVLSEQLPPMPTTPKPPPRPKTPSAKPAGNRTVAQVLSRGCSTVIVKGLSEQIIAEGNCMRPGTYARVPKGGNVNMGKAVFPYMRKPARDALIKATKRGKRYQLKINSMLRTVAQQYLLYDWYKRGRCGIKLAAKPGTSNHQGGLAIDISDPGTWRKILQKQGFRWMGKRDRVHFDYIRGKIRKYPGMDIEAFQRLWNRNQPDEPIDDNGQWNRETEKALRRAPANGFKLGPQCRASKD